MGRNITRQLKQEEGDMVREYRLAVGMTQGELAEAVGMNNKQTIGAIETGGLHIPPERIIAFCEVFGADPQEFAKRVLRSQNPWIYSALFGADSDLKAMLATTNDRINVRRGTRKEA